MNKFKKILLLIFLLIIFTITNAYSYSIVISNALTTDILRLHIIANSNSSEDQIFKLKCRDKIIEYLNTNIDYKNASKNEITSYISSHLSDLYNICNSLAKNENIETTFNISLSTSYFPTKQYSNILIPEGYYDCLKIEIGESTGNNWWCSLYPPLCFTELSTNINESENLNNLSNLENSDLSVEEKELLGNSTTKNTIKFKFKLIELFNSKN